MFYDCQNLTQSEDLLVYVVKYAGGKMYASTIQFIYLEILWK